MNESSPEDELVAFFHALPKAARRELAALAEEDRRHGEHVRDEEPKAREQ